MQYNGVYYFATKSYRRRRNTSTEICQVEEKGNVAREQFC